MGPRPYLGSLANICALNQWLTVLLCPYAYVFATRLKNYCSFVLAIFCVPQVLRPRAFELQHKLQT